MKKLLCVMLCIDTKLDKLGVKRGSLSELGFAVQLKSVEVPDAPNETWYLETYNNVIYNGIRYEVSVLTAESSNTNSELYDSSTKVIHAAPGIGAGTVDYLRILVTAASGTVGTVFGSIYDAVCTTISNLTPYTIIEEVSASYNWQCDTLMHFAYVKRADSGSAPQLSYVYNEVNALALGVTADVVFNNTSHNKLNYGVYQRRIDGVMCAGANNLANAVDSYLNYSQVMHSFVNYVTITGPGNKSIAKNYVCQDIYPGQVG